ncbi:CoA-binding protein [Nocardia neocaledoniensis NBRC 108232]|uniref:Acyl-CoA synthetase (NDP forming) n=1 Tax=Nocardia neocaledoniensis TaxID=236511 RepID=A0A317N230_9NOCA|nr:acetate--CoA ligase family protein [Nocardia neocaledoniensis]PWV67573.1 acyl-CoA synthetase (NDP forming) [Nocardia neocaledoniensis]GEM31271.1 CoA-binding protein [Nocardia neocaledoniensis NBRC 108232]
MLLEYDTLESCLAAAGVPLVRERLVGDTASAVAAAEEFGVPVVLKLISPALIHKADVGAVVLDLIGAEAVGAAADRLTELAAELALGTAGWQILVQEMVRGGTEVFVGIKRDETFGPVVIVGAGGSLVELLPDRALARCPVDTEQAATLLRSTAIGAVLGGYRGQRDVVDEVAEVVAAASRLPEVRPDLLEADLNPVVVTPSGPIVVDARLAVAEEPAPAATAPQAVDLDLRALLEPSSVLVVGASASGAVMPGNLVLRYLRGHGYAGRVVVAHPKATEIDGYPAIAKISDLDHGSIDVVCVAVPAASCAEVLDDCGRVGVRAAVVLSSGFSEVGADELEAQLAAVATRHGIALCGPNTVGLMSPGTRAHVCFSQAQSMASIPATGRVALVAQSGALGGSLASQAWERGIGISRFISVGNQAMLGTSDYLRYLAGDRRTDTIAVVLEGVGDGAALLDAVTAVTAAGKKVFVLKVGRTEAGARAVQSHTGSVAGDYTVYRALLTGAGAVPVDTITELLDALALRDAGHRLSPAARIGIVSTSGGACSMIADLCDQYGFTVPTFSADLRTELGEILPSFAAIANPVDVTGRVATEPAIYGRALAAILASDEVDAVAVLVTTVADPMAEEIAREVARQVAATRKPVIVSWTIAGELAPRGLGLLRAAGIPIFDDPARAIHAAALVK